MAQENGYWAKWLVGILWAVVWGTIIFLGTNLIASDKESRSRDDELESKLNECVMEQTEVNQNILVALAEIKTDISYIKKAVK